MPEQPEQAEVAQPIRLSPAEEVAAIQRDADWENVRLSHAIAMLNNHLPMVGARLYREESWQTTELPAIMDDAPAELRQGLLRAMTAAAAFAERCFTESR